MWCIQRNWRKRGEEGRNAENDMSQMRGMLAKFSKHMRSSFLSQVPKKK